MEISTIIIFLIIIVLIFFIIGITIAHVECLDKRIRGRPAEFAALTLLMLIVVLVILFTCLPIE